MKTPDDLGVEIDRLIFQVFMQLPSENYQLGHLRSGIRKLIESERKKAKIEMLKNMKKSLIVARTGGHFNGLQPIQLPEDARIQGLIEAEFDRNISELGGE